MRRQLFKLNDQFVTLGYKHEKLLIAAHATHDEHVSQALNSQVASMVLKVVIALLTAFT
jgi:hypothetical protein